MENVGSIVNNVLDARGWRGKVLERMAVELWPEVVGDVIARNTIALQFRSGTLHVRARSPMWTQELHFQQDRIIARLNGRLKRAIVQKIRCTVTPPRGIKVGALKPNWEDPTFPESPPPPRVAKPVRDDAAFRRAEKIATTIQDSEMRSVMEKMIASSIRAHDSRQEKTDQEQRRQPRVVSLPTPKKSPVV